VTDASRTAPQRPGSILRRFTTGERWVHRSLATLMAILLITAAILYFGPLSVIVGRRHLVEQIHVFSGFLLPAPIVLGWIWSAALRLDIAEMNRFTAHDWEWLRSRDRRSGRIPVGKFNAGQKLNGAFVIGAILVMLGTGIVMYYTHLLPLAWRTGATFVHDWLAFGIGIVVAGHLWFAAKDPLARAGMRTGLVPAEWAKREHSAWASAETKPAKLAGAISRSERAPGDNP
jgi:formate dehydrogenase subunit gamma